VIERFFGERILLRENFRKVHAVKKLKIFNYCSPSLGQKDSGWNCTPKTEYFYGEWPWGYSLAQ
jgi:hypothetical protein